MSNAGPDLMSVGEHCASCGYIDFMPFVCDCCNRSFCPDHRAYSAHSCPNAADNDVKILVCPICAQAVKLTLGVDAQDAYELHARTDCDPSNYARVHKKPKCPVPGCKEKLKTVNTFTCKACGLDVCLKHRLALDHACTGAQFATAWTVAVAN